MEKKNYCLEGGGKTKQQIVTTVPGTLWPRHHGETDGSMKKGRKSQVNAEIVCPVHKVINSYSQSSNKRQRWPSVTWKIALKATGPSQTILLYPVAWDGSQRAGIHVTYHYIDVTAEIVIWALLWSLGRNKPLKGAIHLILKYTCEMAQLTSTLITLW